MLALFVLFVVMGCLKPAIQAPVSEDTTINPDTVVYDVYYDPMELPDPDLQLDETPLILTRTLNIPEFQPDTQEVMGFRVQLVSTPDFNFAQQKLTRVRSSMGDVGVYFQYDPPQYKLRIGNCRDRREAEKLMRRARAYGFPDAWIVRSRIIISNTSPPAD